jgi:hypothetical protein
MIALNTDNPLMTNDHDRDVYEEGSSAAHADDAAAAAPGDLAPGENLRERQERLLDEAVEETFPASDPIAVADVTKTRDDGA